MAIATIRLVWQTLQPQSPTKKLFVKGLLKLIAAGKKTTSVGLSRSVFGSKASIAFRRY
jgi:hypothetical protein